MVQAKTEAVDVEITVPVGELVKTLTRVREVMLKRSRTLPIVEYALMGAGGDGKLRVQGTNLEQYMTVEAGGVGFVAGDTCVSMLPVRPAMTFLTALLHDGKGMDKKQVHLRLVEKNLTMEVPDVGSLEWNDLPDVDNFPPLTGPAEGFDHGVCDAASFLLALRCAAPAMAEEDTRPVLTCLGVNNQCVVGADGFRLHVFEHSGFGLGLPDDETKEMILLPREAVRLLLKLFKGQEKIECKFHRKVATNRAWFEVDGMILATPLVMGTYPNWRLLIPGEGTTKVSFSAPVMAQRLEMIGEGVEIVRMQTDPAVENGEILKMSAKEEGRKWSLTMPVKLQAAEKGGIAFNRRFLRDGVKLFSLCDLSFTTPSSPGKFTGDIKGLTVVVMPMFVQW